MKSIPLPDEIYARLEREVWDVATDTYCLPQWWDEAYVTPAGNFFVCVVDDSGAATRRLLTKRQLVVAYLSIENPTHCGGYHIIHDADSCSADIILQQALFSSQVYG